MCMADSLVTLSAPDISCEHCIKAINRAVSALPSVQFLDGDPATKEVKLSFDPAITSLDEILGAMDDEGYPVPANAVSR